MYLLEQPLAAPSLIIKWVVVPITTTMPTIMSSLTIIGKITSSNCQRRKQMDVFKPCIYSGPYLVYFPLYSIVSRTHAFNPMFGILFSFHYIIMMPIAWHAISYHIRAYFTLIASHTKRTPVCIAAELVSTSGKSSNSPPTI